MNRMNRINEKDYSRNLPLLFGSTSQFYPEPFQLSINASGAPFKVQIRHVPHRKGFAVYQASKLLRNHGKSARFPCLLWRQSSCNIEIEVGLVALHSCYSWRSDRLTRWTFQFSGDESRRLFANGAKVAENTAESRNLGVITYGSVVFQLKDANLEASNICDFVFRGMRVVCRTRVVTVCLFCLSAVPILMLIYGERRKLHTRDTLLGCKYFRCHSTCLRDLLVSPRTTLRNWKRFSRRAEEVKFLSGNLWARIELRVKNICKEHAASFHVSNRYSAYKRLSIN